MLRHIPDAPNMVSVRLPQRRSMAKTAKRPARKNSDEQQAASSIDSRISNRS